MIKCFTLGEYDSDDMDYDEFLSECKLEIGYHKDIASMCITTDIGYYDDVEPHLKECGYRKILSGANPNSSNRLHFWYKDGNDAEDYGNDCNCCGFTNTFTSGNCLEKTLLFMVAESQHRKALLMKNSDIWKVEKFFCVEEVIPLKGNVSLVSFEIDGSSLVTKFDFYENWKDESYCGYLEKALYILNTFNKGDYEGVWQVKKPTKLEFKTRDYYIFIGSLIKFYSYADAREVTSITAVGDLAIIVTQHKPINRAIEINYFTGTALRDRVASVDNSNITHTKESTFVVY